MINANRARELFNYDPETGMMRWRVSLNGRAMAGGIAGTTTARGCIQIRADGRIYLAHRIIYLIMTGDWPKKHIDHINHNPADNRWINLRDADPEINGRNQSMKRNNITGITSVYWDSRCRRWVSQIRYKGRKKHGYFGDDFFEACCARKTLELKYKFHPNHGKRL